MSLHLIGGYDIRRPTELVEQHFGVGLHPEDLLAPSFIPNINYYPHHPHLNRLPYYRSWRLPSKEHGASITCDKNKYQVNLDVQQFSPEELSVKVVDNNVIVEGKHEEKQDEHGFISRQFQRRYTVPKGHDIHHIATELSSDGILTITAPRTESLAENQERSVPIVNTGAPHKAVLASLEPKEADKK